MIYKEQMLPVSLRNKMEQQLQLISHYYTNQCLGGAAFGQRDKQPYQLYFCQSDKQIILFMLFYKWELAVS